MMNRRIAERPSGATTNGAMANAARVSTTEMWPRLANDERRIQIALAGLPLVASRWCLGIDRKSGLAVDESAHQLVVLEVGKIGKEKEGVQRRLFSYADIIESQVVEDSRVLASSSAARWDASTSGGKVECVALKLTLREGEATRETSVKFLDKAQSHGSDAHKSALAKAREWHNFVLALIGLGALMNRS